MHVHGGGVTTDPSLGLLQVALVGDGIVLHDRLSSKDLHSGDLGDTIILLVCGRPSQNELAGESVWVYQ